MLKLPKEERKTMSTLENMRIRTNQGIKVPLYSVAKINEVEGSSSIRRVDGMRVVGVSSDVDVTKNTSTMILQKLLNADSQPIGPLSDILQEHRDVDFELAGEAAEQAEQLQAVSYTHLTLPTILRV